MTIQFEYASAWILLIVVLAALAGFTLYFFRVPRPWPKTWRSLLAVLRGVVALLLGILLLQPFIVRFISEEEKPLLFYFVDASASIDSTGYAQGVEMGEALQAVMRDRFDVRLLRFSDAVYPWSDSISNGLSTDIGMLFPFINEGYEGANLGAVIIASDGIMNTGVDPRYQSLNFNAPVHSILLGDTSVSPDMRIDRIRVNSLAFLGNALEIKVDVSAYKLKGETVKLELQRDGKIIESTTFPVKDALFTRTERFFVDADVLGLVQYTAVVSVDLDEENTENNRSDAYVEVLDNRTRVKLLAKAPHPDIAAMRSSIERSDQYEVSVELMRDWQGGVKDADLFILHGLPSNEEEMRRLSSIHENGIQSLAVVTSTTSLVHFNALNFGVRIRSDRGQRDESGALVNTSFNLFNLSENTQLNRFPPLNVPFAKFEFLSNAQLALKQRIGGIATEQPFLLFTEQDGQKNGILLAEGWWRWRMFERMLDVNADWTDEVIQKSVQYLAIKQKRTRLNVNIPDRFSEGQPVIVEAEYYNESFELSNNVELKLQLTYSSDRSFDYLMPTNGSAYRLDLGSLAPGKYAWKMTVNTGDAVFEQTGEVSVIENRAEFKQKVADHKRLAELANRSGGNTYKPTEADALIKDLQELPSAKPVIHTEQNWSSAIEWKTILYLIVLLLGLEWIFRKANGYA